MEKFVNGFRSWMETHHEVCEMIALERAKDEKDQAQLIRDTGKLHGTCGFYDLAESITNEFENLNEGRQWDGEFFDEIELFVEKSIR